MGLPHAGLAERQAFPPAQGGWGGFQERQQGRFPFQQHCLRANAQQSKIFFYFQNQNTNSIFLDSNVLIDMISFLLH